MELLKLRRRAETARRGHKLLKDKLDELLKEFMARIAENRRLRARSSAELFVGVRAARDRAGRGRRRRSSPRRCSPVRPRTCVSADERNVMSVRVPVLEVGEVPSPRRLLATRPRRRVLDGALERPRARGARG